MNYVTLEKLRYEMHQDWLKKEFPQTFKHIVTLSQWWKDVGAFTLLAPRQTGKTTFLKEVVAEKLKDGENVLVITAYEAMRNSFTEFLEDENFTILYQRSLKRLQGSNRTHYHLFVDEFMHIDELNSLLNHDWKSVTLVGSLFLI